MTGPDAVPAGVRLQKVLAGAGVGSRRACEALIYAGRVTVDGQRVTSQGLRVDPLRAVIHVDGKRVVLDSNLVTVALNKPAGVVTTMTDPQGRPTVAGLIGDIPQRLHHIGRLDTDTEGLLLLSNDGELTHRLTHPSYEVAKTYIATVRGHLGGPAVRALRDGVELEDGPIAADSVRILDAARSQSMVEITLHSGRNRIVRRMLDHVGHPVLRLVRTRIGPVRLGDLPPGAYRRLTGPALGELMAAVGL